MNRRWLGSWLGGPTSAEQVEPPAYPGERLGLPAEGSSSVVTIGRRIAALFVDWLLCSVIGYALSGGQPWAPLAIFAAENVLLLATLGSTVGHRLLGFRVVRPDGRLPGLQWTLVRTVLLCFFVPAVILDADRRGLHERASDTVAVRI